MNHKAKHIVAMSALIGGLFGFLIISPLAMIISDLVHQNHIGSYESISFVTLMGTSLKEALGPGFYVWKASHTAIGALFALLLGLIFQHLLKQEQKLHTIESQFQRNELTLEIGKLVRGIVHNINNHLAVIKGNTELLKMDYPKNDKVNEVLSASKELEEMAQNILDHAKSSYNTSVKEIDLNITIEKNLEFLKGNSFFKQRVKVIKDFDPHLPQIMGQRIDFSQVIYNLLDNAVDAMTQSPKKELRIATRHDEENVYVEIIDSGEGIPKDVFPRLFTSGFTTKPFEAKKDEPTGRVCDLLRYL